LAGEFNVANALLALACAAEAGLDPALVARGLGRSGGVPGRLERVDAGQGFSAIVDYAHKPDAVRAVLEALRPVTAGRLVVVLGAGGDRDTGKRPVMGEIAASLADVLIVTDDNPRSEDPARIRAEILAGAQDGRAEVRDVAGRRTAIAEAVRLAAPGDTVLVAGKGHESGQEAAGVVEPFDDRRGLREETERGGGGASWSGCVWTRSPPPSGGGSRTAPPTSRSPDPRRSTAGMSPPVGCSSRWRGSGPMATTSRPARSPREPPRSWVRDRRGSRASSSRMSRTPSACWPDTCSTASRD